jgi:hypothetical protein
MQLALADGSAGITQEIQDLYADRVGERLGEFRDRRGADAIGHRQLCHIDGHLSDDT